MWNTRKSLTTDAASVYNEDIAGFVQGGAWVLDGATGITDSSHTDSVSDGHWYVNEFDQYLRSNLSDWSMSLSKVIEEGIQTVRNRFYDNQSCRNIDTAAEPSATAAIVRWNNETLEYFVLCDSHFVSTKNGEVEMWETDDRIQQFEPKPLNRMKYFQELGYGFRDARKQILPLLRATRRDKNTNSGYWVLSFDPDAAQAGIKGEIPIDSATNIHLYTDGFFRLIDRFHYFQTVQELIDALQTEGVPLLLDTLRKIEDSDPECQEYPRFKPCDDVTVVNISFDNCLD
jgi:hypothetical protein